MEKNKDYIKGMKYLLKESKKANLEIRRYPWVVSFSHLLSKYKACYNFWKNTVEQNNLLNISLCLCFSDIFFGTKSCLFIWDETSEGDDYWRNMEENMEIKLNIRKINDTSLYYVFGGSAGKWFPIKEHNDNLEIDEEE